MAHLYVIMRNNEIVKGMLLQLTSPIPHYSAVAHSIMQYCKIHDFFHDIYMSRALRAWEALQAASRPSPLPAPGNSPAASTGAPRLGRG
jgi:hypothetical protein